MSFYLRTLKDNDAKLNKFRYCTQLLTKFNDEDGKKFWKCRIYYYYTNFIIEFNNISVDIKNYFDETDNIRTNYANTNRNSDGVIWIDPRDLFCFLPKTSSAHWISYITSFYISEGAEMLAAKKLPEILRGVLTDGVEGAVVMTYDGSILASEFITLTGSVNETSLAAITSSIWSNYTQQGMVDLV